MVPITHFSGEKADGSVRFIAVGARAIQFVESLRAQAPSPLANPFSSAQEELLVGDLLEAAGRVDLAGVAILFVVFAVDDVEDVIDVALFLNWCTWERDGYVIGIAVSAKHSVAPPVSPRQELLLETLDGRIDIAEHAGASECEALCWFLAALNQSVAQNELILEPQWDLGDVVEVLDLAGAQLTLVTEQAEEGEDLDSALERALEQLDNAGIDLECASGAMVVIWHGVGHRIPGRLIRDAGRTVDRALGAGGLHMTLTCRAPGPWSGGGVCVTLVVSRNIP